MWIMAREMCRADFRKPSSFRLFPTLRGRRLHKPDDNTHTNYGLQLSTVALVPHASHAYVGANDPLGRN